VIRLPRRVILISIAAALALIAAAGFGAAFAWTHYTASLGPFDLAASREASTIVVDRDGRLLRPFTLPDGRWRLPATTHDVDPRYVAMLVAYEDGRFYNHDGVDLRALVRAGAQWLIRSQAQADRAGAGDRARSRQAWNARPLPHAGSVRRQP
jgi:penicillin-binding protein 1C